MRGLSVLHVVPYLPPAVSGVGDYAMVLARALRAGYGIECVFAVGNGVEGEDLEGFRVVSLRRGEDLGRVALGFDRVLLQYVGYGYERRGCPVWLIRALRGWQAARPDGRLVTMFHELYAFGPPWRSSFWVHLVQRWVCGQLARMSFGCMTNRAESRARLNRLGGREDVVAVPVFSNVGEPEAVPGIGRRPAQMVVYGGMAASAVGRLRRQIEELGVRRVVRFGARGGGWPELGVPFYDRGRISAVALSDLLLESRVGWLDYFDGYLAKSGIFAAYCAHGVVPVLFRENDSEADGLVAAKHFLAGVNWGVSWSQEELEVVANNARAWYGTHTVARCAAAVTERLGGVFL